MKLSEMVRNEDVLAHDLQDPDARAEWEKLALARLVAARVAGYRALHGLTQAQLAAKVGMKQSAVARLEGGEHDPTLGTLAILAGRLGMEFVIDVAPARRSPALVRRNVERVAVSSVRYTAPAGTCILLASR